MFGRFRPLHRSVCNRKLLQPIISPQNTGGNYIYEFAIGGCLILSGYLWNERLNDAKLVVELDNENIKLRGKLFAAKQELEYLQSVTGNKSAETLDNYRSIVNILNIKIKELETSSQQIRKTRYASQK